MKILIAASVAALLLGANAATAAPFYGPPMNGAGFHRGVVRHVPRHDVWVRGDRFVPAYGRHVVVSDWRPFHLRRPAYGHHWVRAGGNFLLVDNRTGMIVDVMFDRF